MEERRDKWRSFGEDLPPLLARICSVINTATYSCYRPLFLIYVTFIHADIRRRTHWESLNFDGTRWKYFPIRWEMAFTCACVWRFLRTGFPMKLQRESTVLLVYQSPVICVLIRFESRYTCIEIMSISCRNKLKIFSIS